MPVTAADIQRIITLRVGDIDPVTGDPPISGGAGMVASNIAMLWAARADKALVAPRLQELYVQRDALDLVIAILRQWVDVTQGDPALAVRQNQRVAEAELQRKATQDEIVAVEDRAAKVRSGALGQILQQEPVSPADALRQQQQGWPDASSPAYSGSPYTRVRRRFY